MTVFARGDFTYGVRFSSDDYVARCGPARSDGDGALDPPRRGEAGSLARRGSPSPATGFWLAALLIVAGWDHLEREARALPLVAALPGNGRSVESEVSRGWDNPPSPATVGAGEMLLDRYWPGEEEALVLLESDLSVEALMRTGRVNLLPVSDFLADNLVAEERWEQVAPPWTRSSREP